MVSSERLSVFMPLTIGPAMEKVREALKAQGFGVLTEVDVQATLREKLGADFYPYRLLGACNPELAYRALEIDPALGVFLPCTVAVYDTGAGTEVHVQDPTAALTDDAPAGLRTLVATARDRLEQVVAALRA
jgi:uncharacterized protein (DUF302 family)